MAKGSKSQSAKFEERVRGALSAYEEKFRESSAADQPLPKLSVSALAKFGAFSRSVLYAEHRLMVGVIETAFAALLDEQTQKARYSKPQSYTALKQELAAVRKRAKRDLAIARSVTLRQLLDQDGPTARDTAMAMAERQMLLTQNAEFKEVIAKQAKTIRDLMQRLNRQ